jgi:hypothetical protein
LLLQSKPSWSSSAHLKHLSFPLHWPLPCPHFWHWSIVLNSGHMNWLVKINADWW